MKSSSETFDVFEFKEEDEVGFSPPSKMKTPKFVDDGKLVAFFYNCLELYMGVSENKFWVF